MRRKQPIHLPVPFLALLFSLGGLWGCEESSVTLNGLPAALLSSSPSEIEIEVPHNTRCLGPERECMGPLQLSVGNRDGIGTEAELNGPSDIAIDSATGNLYVVDGSSTTPGGRIRKLVFE